MKKIMTKKKIQISQESSIHENQKSVVALKYWGGGVIHYPHSGSTLGTFCQPLGLCRESLKTTGLAVPRGSFPFQYAQF